MTSIVKLLANSVVGSALAVGPMTLSTAPASADQVDWDAVAQCESSGHWSTDTGNGFRGGLQFKQSTWSEFGGKGNPAAASRVEQIQVANRTLRGQGLDAWPLCGPLGVRHSTSLVPEPTGCQGLSGSVLGVVDPRQLCASLTNAGAALAAALTGR
jgi:hypothetical protein